MTQAHAERAHALLGASKAIQWINCPPSARLTENVQEKRSEYADEGTLAHELAEIKLRRRLTPCNSKERKRLEEALAKVQANKMYGPEMENAIQEYLERVEERFMAAKARSPDAVIIFEDWLDFSEWTAPEQGGIGDVSIISDGVLDVIDLKYGKGVPVSAIGNPQIRMYGLGAWSNYNYLYDIREMHLTIDQPRLDSVTTEVMPVVDLLEWAEAIVRPAAALAYEGKGEFKPGDHCRWCKVKATCRARADENMKALEYEFKDPALMDLEEIGQILFVAQQLAKWAGDIEEYAFDQSKAGKRVPGWKLVEGRSNRSFTDKEAVKAKLIEAGFEESKILKPEELVSITDLEKKVVGKKQFGALLNDLIVKPPGKPTLVPETDPRTEMNSVEKDFENEEFQED